MRENPAFLIRWGPRTLQRRLNPHGIGFWALVEQSRFKISSAFLRETDLKTQEIAASIGYSTPAWIARAFTKWAGYSPNAYRSALSDVHRRAAEWREKGRSETRQPVAFASCSDVTEET